jgi:putative transposase
MSQARQLTLPKHGGWGGRRRGAGRKPKAERSGVSHGARPVLARRFPVHVTLRVLPHVWNLRSRRGVRVVKRALASSGNRLGLRICEFSVQGNHLHLIVEAEDTGSLSRGMQGLGIRLAKGLNGMMTRNGKVLADRFHAHILRTPTEVFRAFNYVRQNRAVHRGRWSVELRTEGRVGMTSAEADRLGLRSMSIGRPTGPIRRGTNIDLCSSAAPNHGVPLPKPLTYLLLRARAEALQQVDAGYQTKPSDALSQHEYRIRAQAEKTSTSHAPLLFFGRDTE